MVIKKTFLGKESLGILLCSSTIYLQEEEFTAISITKTKLRSLLQTQLT